MIIYKTNGGWFVDVGHLFRSWTMTKIVRAMMAIGVYALIVVLCLHYFEGYELIHMNTAVFSLLGVVLSIFLVFRTNSAYDRWWEARKQWGALVNHSRNLAVYIDGMFPEEDQESRTYLARHISNFVRGLADHLREGVYLGTAAPDETKAGLERKILDLTAEERKNMEPLKHRPNHLVSLIFKRIHKVKQAGGIDEGDYINIKPQHQAFLDILGACERIKKTPIPFSYAVYLKIFITAYGLMLPFALVNQFGFSTIPLTMFIFFALLGVELLGEEIEDPFGLDCNDLPTGLIADTISQNVYEILDPTANPYQIPKTTAYQKVF
ncbi:MAG: bestrophin family protein [Bacteroidia bacterium]